MCGRFTYLYKWRDIHRLLSIHDAPFQTELPLRYNVAPTQDAPVAVQTAEGKREIRMLRWGLIPWWAKDESGAGKMINARAEGVATKPAFREAFKQRRCLVPVSGFYEWQKTGDSKRKQPWYIRVRGGEPFCMAGVWERWKSPDRGDVHTFAVITTEPNDLMRPLHDRMPVILPPSSFDRWLNHDGPADSLACMLMPFPAAAMEAYRVSTRVNSPRIDDAGCVEPLETPATDGPVLFD